MNEKPRLSFLQIWNMSVGFFGIQFGFALQNSNTSFIFSKLGAKTDELAILWLAAPITGLLIQPIIGYYSDRTWHPVWGRRRPYFTIGAILASIALCVMPNSSSLWVAVGTLWIMDASINISMEPFRALIGDMLPSSQRTQGYSMQSIFIGAGAVAAAVVPFMLVSWFGTTLAAPDGEISNTVRYSFYAGAVMLLSMVMWTVMSTHEYPPEKNEMHARPVTVGEDVRPGRFLKSGSLLLIAGIMVCAAVGKLQLEKELYVLGGGLSAFGAIFLLTYLFVSQNKGHLAIVQMARDFLQMPKTMVQLAFVQFFSWVALFAMWIYTTPVVALQVFGTDDPSTTAYGQAAVWVGLLFGVYSAVAAFAAMVLPLLARVTSRRVTHLIALSCGGAGLISFLFIHDQYVLLASMVGVGIAWASILSVPYAMLSTSLPSEKMGYYMGVFNFFIVIPQIVAATVLGFLLRHVYGGNPVYIFVTGGACMIIAGLLSLMVDDKDEIKVAP